MHVCQCVQVRVFEHLFVCVCVCGCLHVVVHVSTSSVVHLPIVLRHRRMRTRNTQETSSRAGD